MSKYQGAKGSLRMIFLIFSKKGLKHKSAKRGPKYSSDSREIALKEFCFTFEHCCLACIKKDPLCAISLENMGFKDSNSNTYDIPMFQI